MTLHPHRRQDLELFLFFQLWNKAGIQERGLTGARLRIQEHRRVRCDEGHKFIGFFVATEKETSLVL